MQESVHFILLQHHLFSKHSLLHDVCLQNRLEICVKEENLSAFLRVFKYNRIRLFSTK